MNKEKLIDYLDEQFWKHKAYECMPENDMGYEYVPRDRVSRIIDGLIPMIKYELKISKQKELLIAFLTDWYKENPFITSEKIEKQVNEFLSKQSKQ